MVERYCTECGVPSGEKHIRSKLYLWKKKPRDLIESDKKKMQQMIVLRGREKYSPAVNLAS